MAKRQQLVHYTREGPLRSCQQGPEEGPPMSEENALMTAARLTPPDDPARLVYADWLEEQGDPRGDFIRIQAEMERLPPYSDRYVALKARREEVRGRIDAKWLRWMRYVPRHRPLFHTLPAGRVECWRLMEEFIDVWHRPLRAGHGSSERELASAEKRLGTRLPAALREWYALAGRRKDVWSRQDRLLPPEQLRFDRAGDALIIRSENQGCERWGIQVGDLGQDDPPVFELEEGARSSPTTTAFALLVLLYEVKFARAVHWYGGEVPEEVLRRPLGTAFHKCELPDRYWVASPVSFFEGTDVLVEIEGNGWAYVAARTKGAFAQVPEELREHLENYGP
jgi:uncharacterized protein (TIGR02996 family)